MNGLALLCNLFTDGPVTLGRLRAAHVESLADVERTAPERLASILHASVPQASGFAVEARRLAQRLAEEAGVLLASGGRAGAGVERAFVLPRPPEGGSPPAPFDAVLVPGLLPGLDEALCARLARNRVRTVRALAESAGLALARRSGIPYRTLLDLAREARRSALPEHVSRRSGLPPDSELDGPDAFTLPSDAGAAGPFG
jgi:hypothetical protein